MATVVHSDSREMCSWWWNSHISPKNSKWLQETLSDMDAKIKEMINLMREDGDSFAKRAEMFYRNRPHLLDLLEQFYRAFRALAERYDHASGVLRQAHKSVAEAFPDKAPSVESGALLDTNELDVGKFLQNELNRINDLQESVAKAETTIEMLKQDLGRVEAEKGDAIGQYTKSLETVRNLEEKLMHAMENVTEITEKFNGAKGEVGRLKLTLAETTEEKEAFAHQYRQSLMEVSKMEQSISCAQDEVQRLNSQTETTTSKLVDAEEKCLQLGKLNQDLELRLQESMEKMELRSEELLVKSKHLEQLQEEHQRLVEVEAAFEKLQNVHQKSQEELQFFTLELQSKTQVLENVQAYNQDLHEKIEKANNDLKEVNSAVLLKLKNDHPSMREIAKNLEAEIRSLVREQNALHQEIDCLKNQLEDMKVEAKETRHQLKVMEESHESLVSERTSLTSQLESANHYKEKLETKCDNLESSLSDANAKLEVLKLALQRLESSWSLLFYEKLSMIANSEAVGVKCKELERKCLDLDSERETAIAENSKLQLDLDQQRKQHSVQLSSMENQILQLQRETLSTKKEREELDKALNVEINNMKSSIQDLKDRNSSLSLELEKIVKFSEERVHDMEYEIFKRDLEIKSLSDQPDETLMDNVELQQDVSKGMLPKAQDLQNCLSETVDQNLEMVIERSILYTVLGQVKLEATNVATETEKHVASLFENLVMANVSQAVFKDQIHELTEAHHNSEESKSLEIKELSERIGFLEGENCRLASMLPISRIAAEVWTSECGKTSEKCSIMFEDPWHNIETTGSIKSLEEAAPLDISRVTPEISSSSTEGLKNQDDVQDIRSSPRRKEPKKHTNRQQKPTRRQVAHGEIAQGEGEVLTKDIVLDQMSKHPETDDRMLELWETTDIGSSINLKVGLRSRSHSKVADIHHSSESVSLTEKELGIDGPIEMSDNKLPRPSRVRSGRRVVERLNSDVQKLTNLQITVQDLRRKVDLTDQRAEEYDNIKEQLEDAEVAIMNFFDANQKLSKSAQKAVLIRKSTEEYLKGSGSSCSMRRISEQARRMTEEIGRLQVELQRIQWLLVKLDEESKKERRGGGSSNGSGRGMKITKVSERKAKVLLKDILHVKVKNNLKKKKGQFCACVQLPSRSK